MASLRNSPAASCSLPDRDVEFRIKELMYYGKQAMQGGLARRQPQYGSLKARQASQTGFQP
jgi:hypothetical protein